MDKDNRISIIENFDIFIDNEISSIGMGQKLFCTFTLHGDLEKTLDHITDKYTVLYDKIFVLESPQIGQRQLAKVSPFHLNISSIGETRLMYFLSTINDIT